MWKKALIALMAIIGILSMGFIYVNSNINANANTYSGGGIVSGRIGDLQSLDRFYIYTNEYPFRVVSNDFGEGIFALSDESIGSITWTDHYGDPLLTNSNYRKFLKKMNEDIDTRDSDRLLNRYSKPNIPAGNTVQNEPNNIPADEVPYFIGTPYYYMLFNLLGPTANSVASGNYAPYFEPYTWFGNNYTDVNMYTPGIINASGVPDSDPTLDAKYGVQPGILVKKDLIVFALSKPDSSGSFTAVDTGNTNHERMKLRLKNNGMNAVINDIVNQNGDSITAVTENGSITIKGQANQGTDTYGNPYTVSLIILNSSGEFVYYKPIEPAKGTGDYRVDLTGIPIGQYQLAIVNEAYNENSIIPADSSPLSNRVSFSVTEPHKLIYTAQPESGASAGKDYEFNKNVNTGQTVGKITVNPIGAMPLSYTIEENGDNTYQNFEIDGLDDNHASFASMLNVKIKNDAPDLVDGGLKAGTYQFCISAQDNNGNPQTPTESSGTKVCASFTVENTDLTVAFNDPNQTKKSITEAQAGWSETASATPSAGTKLTYSVSGGSIGLINIDSNTGAITYTGGSACGKVEIKATADDDPANGNDNYEPSETTKEIIIYREVDGSVTPHENSSSTTSPTFQTSDVNIKPNGVIGKIIGTMGTPDQVSSGNTTYTYGLKNVDDYNYFSVNPTTGEIKTTADLSSTIDDYHITVTVSDQWSTKEIPVLISVGLAPAEDLKFYENSTSNTVINTKTVNFTDTNVSVFATVKNSSNNNPVTYRIQDGSTNIITINSNSGAITITGTGTVTIVAEKQGASGQANAQTTLTFTVTAGAQNFIYTTDSTLSTERPKTGNNYAPLTETYEANKTFQVYTAGNPSGSIVTYQLKANSPTDVISVDRDGTIHILNASKNDQIGKVIVQATSHDPSGNFDDKTIELPITIEKGTRTITFEENPIYVINGSGSVTPNILVDGVLDTDNNAMIEVDSSQNSIAWTNDGQTIQYNWNDVNGKDIPLHVTKPADRNYKIAEGDGTLHILGADESALTLNTPGKIIYGDRFTIKSTQDDSGSNNVQYTFETDNQVFISAPVVNGNKAEFDALGNSGNTMINVTVTRTADGELPMTKTVQIKVLPKPITITIDNKDKLRLEDNPPLTFQDITSQLVSWNGVKDSIDTGHIRLSTTAVKYSPIGSYPITSGNAEKQLNDNYPNYTFTIKQGLLNVLDNGNKDFWDVDDDGCPDINIKITDDEGNEITINGDLNDDGIPDYNIDTNGDGKPDLNIDTDKDDKPDLNLVILKEWKPTKCVTLDDIQFSSGITAKAEINIDLDGDLIPDINIDNKGDFKAHINISKDGTTAKINLADIHEWLPGKDYRKGTFQYDSVGSEIKPQLNIDTDDDGRPDINLDLDDDGVPDLNIDTDGDNIPDLDIDGDGDGNPDINVDIDKDGIADENIMDIPEWKPEHNVDQPFEYDTVKIEKKKELEDNGVKIEKPDGSPFPPSMALKVIDVTTEQKAEIETNAKDFLNDKQEVKQVFEVKLLENGKEIQPDGKLRIKIPIAEGYKNAILVRQNEAGEYEKIDATLEDGYLVYESDTLGIVSIIAEIENEVQGSYYPGANMGGALTGDTTNIMLYMGFGCLALGLICLILFQFHQVSHHEKK